MENLLMMAIVGGAVVYLVREFAETFRPQGAKANCGCGKSGCAKMNDALEAARRAR
jgi:hypothetical protein